MGSIIFFLVNTLLTLSLGIVFFPLLILPCRAPARWLAKFWLKLVLKCLDLCCGLTVEFRGSLPKGPVVLASKHQSTLETFALALHFDIPVFVLKKTLLSIPIFGWFLAKVGVVSIDPKGGRRAIQNLQKKLKKFGHENRSYVIFPQGSRLKPGVSGKYLPGVALLNKVLDLPIVPVAVNTGLFWPKGQFFKKPGQAVIEFMPVLPKKIAKKPLLEKLEKVIEQRSNKLCQSTQTE